MNDFNVEIYSEKINDKRTKKYFKEVSSSYFNGNYRAAVVTLYSVVINDLILKLEHLEDLYSDNVAKEILKFIRSKQDADRFNSSWEKELVKTIFLKTNLLTNVDKTKIDNLTNDRHLCAHPVIDNEDKLYTPNKETTLSHITNMLESVLLKPAILSKKILKSILQDLEDKQSILLIDEDGVENFIIKKYLIYLNPNLEKKIFKELWKFVFKLTDENCDKNRIVNYRALNTIFNRNKDICVLMIKEETSYFNNISEDIMINNLLIRFLAENDYLVSYFRNDNLTTLSEFTEEDVGAYIVAWFFNKDYLSHLKDVKTILEDLKIIQKDYKAIRRLLIIGKELGYKANVQDFIIDNYSKSENYARSDYNFKYILMPNFELLDLYKINQLCKKSNTNNQNYNRLGASGDHELLKSSISDKFGDQFNFNDYNNLFIE